MSKSKKTASVVMEFKENSECEYGVNVIVEDSPASPGDDVEIHVYASTKAILSSCVIYNGSTSMGKGGSISSESDSIIENIFYSNNRYGKSTYPLNTITTQIASTEIVEIKNDLISNLYTKGSIISAIKKGDICLDISNSNANGSVSVSYSYYIYKKTYSWIAPEIESDEVEYPFFLEKEGKIVDDFSIVVSDKTKGEDDDIKFIIKDIANDALIKDASVTISSSDDDFITLTDTTDINGEVVFTLSQGDSYSILINHAEYISSDTDNINNDTFTVPKSVES